MNSTLSPGRIDIIRFEAAACALRERERVAHSANSSSASYLSWSSRSGSFLSISSEFTERERAPKWEREKVKKCYDKRPKRRDTRMGGMKRKRAKRTAVEDFIADE